MAIRTSKADHNYFSISNGITNCNGEVGVPIPTPPVFTPDNPEQYDAILKVADGTNGLSFDGLEVSQGQENAVDLNFKAHDIYFNGRYGEVGQTGDQVLTAKGGTHDIAFRGIMRSRGKRYDACWGQWSDQSFEPTYNIDTSQLIHIDNKPIRLVVGRAKWPTKAQRGPCVKILFWWSIGIKCYWWAKWCYVKLLGKKAST